MSGGRGWGWGQQNIFFGTFQADIACPGSRVQSVLHAVRCSVRGVHKEARDYGVFTPQLPHKSLNFAKKAFSKDFYDAVSRGTPSRALLRELNIRCDALCVPQTC